MTRAIVPHLLRHLFFVRASKRPGHCRQAKAVAAADVARTEDRWCERFILGTGDFSESGKRLADAAAASAL
jgi:hypothetical protein